MVETEDMQSDLLSYEMTADEAVWEPAADSSTVTEAVSMLCCTMTWIS